MAEDKKALIDLVPESIDNAVRNISDKPTQNIGVTLADIWYLIFGGISQAADKRKLKYSYDLKKFENELKEKISKIPENKLTEPDIQIIAKALEEAKYSVEKEDLREMFSNLISKSLNSDTKQNAHPLFINIISQLTSSEAKLLKEISEVGESVSIKMDVNYDSNDVRQLLISISILEHSGLIKSDISEKIITETMGEHRNLLIQIFKGDGGDEKNRVAAEKANHIYIRLTELGKLFCMTCIDN